MAGGHFWTGVAGLANGISSTGFLAGAASGASAGFAGGFIHGACNSWVEGFCFRKGFLYGLSSGVFGAFENSLIGGISSGTDAIEVNWFSECWHIPYLLSLKNRCIISRQSSSSTPAVTFVFGCSTRGAKVL